MNKPTFCPPPAAAHAGEACLSYADTLHGLGREAREIEAKFLPMWKFLENFEHGWVEKVVPSWGIVMI
jgi:hypothetical protein